MSDLGNFCGVVPKFAIPPVSVVISTFNGANVIGETLESVRNQTFQDFEVIIVNDGSTDGTADVVRRFCESDPRFTFVTQSNAGNAAARNTGILRARGEWIALLDHDDVWFPQKLERQLTLSHEDPRANFLFANFYFWNGVRDLNLMYPDGEPFPEGDTIRLLIFSFNYLPSTVAVRRQTLLDTGMFDPKMRMAEDWDMWLRIAEHGIWARGIREPLVRYRRWPGSITVVDYLASIDYNALVIKKRIRATQRAELLPLYRRSLAAVQTNCEMLRARRLVETKPAALPPFIWRAWRLDPRSKWLRWYLCLVWPKFLGGNITRRYVHRKIRGRWPDTNNDSMTKNPPLVSIIMPVWNGATFLAEALCSLQAQTYAHFEVIIVDDGSTDATPAIVRRFCESDSRFTFTQQTHAGVSVARNTALARSRGKFIAFLDADDVWSPEKLARQIELFAEDPRVNAVFTNFYMWDGRRDLRIWYRPDKPLPEGDVSRRLVFNVGYACAASMSVAVIRRELFHEAGCFDPELSIGEDWDLLLRMAECGLRVRVTREPLARYRRWNGNATNQKFKMIKSNVQVLQKNLQKTRRPELRPLYKRSLAHARAQLELFRARRFVENQPDAVPAAVWRAWRICPGELKWLMRLVLVTWPNFLGGGATARIVHRKLIQKF